TWGHSSASRRRPGRANRVFTVPPNRATPAVRAAGARRGKPGAMGVRTWIASWPVPAAHRDRSCGARQGGGVPALRAPAAAARDQRRRPRHGARAAPGGGAGAGLRALGAALELAAAHRMEGRLGLVGEAYTTGKAWPPRQRSTWLTAAGLPGAGVGSMVWSCGPPRRSCPAARDYVGHP